ncbi:AAA family ATPase [Nonomuraea phyllanthi]|uniref:ATP-binding protein n=1 Tax=Nonomuraea phyllanthi TaxID=2219224 RepID=UPI001293972B|nr:ATP-binding protein [Nonomuraea phyllanthi]QFY08204.1 AAA family ATPase [Nonomuraea phyllanthi]
MKWHFIGRGEQLTMIRTALRDASAGPIVVTGEPGVGRSRLAEHVLESPEAARYEIVRLRAGDDAAGVAARVEAIAGDRPVLLFMDDAQAGDDGSLLALRAAARRHAHVRVLVTTLSGPAARRPDPVDCLRFEPGARTVELAPLTAEEVAALLAAVAGGHVRQATADALRAASGGNPRLLHDFLVGRRLTERLTRGAAGWEFQCATEWLPPVDPAAATPHLVDAVWEAWAAPAFDRAFELCKAAAWCGEGHTVSVPLAHLLLLRGRGRDSMSFLDSLPGEIVDGTPHLALARAVNLACGQGRPEEAADFLLRLALAAEGGRRPLLLAYRAWIMALSGRPAGDVGEIPRTDRETALFVHAAKAMAGLRTRPDEAVFHLRRALALTAGGMGAGPPWLPAHLTAYLIDALLLAGRAGEATLLASGFHGGEPASGWDVAAAMSMVAA